MQLLDPGAAEIGSQEPLPAPEKGGSSESEESEERRAAAEDPAGSRKARVKSPRANEIRELRKSKMKYARKYKETMGWTAKLERKIGLLSRSYDKALKEQAQRILAMEDDLARTKELLSARSTELSGAQSFLSTTDRFSEGEILSIVRDLNENIFQVATNLGEEWEKLASSQSNRFAVAKTTLDSFSEFYGPTLIHQAFHRDLGAVTYLIQSCFCFFVSQITSGWRRRGDEGIREELRILGPIYGSLAGSEVQAISARWKSLTHSNLTVPSTPYDSASIAEGVANVLCITESFQYPSRSVDFVTKKALNGIETIHKLALRLETAFMVDVTSSDMYLLCEAPLTVFDNERMAREVESDESPPTRSPDRVAGVTEVGVEKRVWGRRDEDWRSEVLLKSRVVLEKDILNS